VTSGAPASDRTVTRHLRAFEKDSWRQQICACAAHAGLGPASLVPYDVSTLYFETDAGDGFREPGFSKERQLAPQITIGLLTDQDGFPLMAALAPRRADPRRHVFTQLWPAGPNGPAPGPRRAPPTPRT